MSENNPQVFVSSHLGGMVFSQSILLRDLFAMAALNGMLASDSSVDRTKVKKDVWAGVAYSFADAMLRERAKAQP